jgi:adenosylmethionine-8-amino-7-oxononanoate aminotransferase
VLAPPYTLADGQIDELVDKLAKSLDRALKG